MSRAQPVLGGLIRVSASGVGQPSMECISLPLAADGQERLEAPNWVDWLGRPDNSKRALKCR